MRWEKDGSELEVRTQGRLADGRPALDEVVARGATIHLEQMSHDGWWMGIAAAGKYFHLNFGLRDGRLYVRLSDESDGQTEYPSWEGDDREHLIPGLDEE